MFKNYKTSRWIIIIGFLFLFVLFTSYSSNNIDNLDYLVAMVSPVVYPFIA